jgi:folate-binding protein YgfZ
MDDVTIRDQSDETAELGLYGAGAAAMRPQVERSGLRVLTAPLGLHVIAASADLDALARELALAPLTPEAVEVMRIERGVSRYGAEISEDVLPLEAGLDDAVSLSKGCYIGQEPVARVTARGHVNKKIVGLVCASPVAPGDALVAPDRKEAGRVTSAAQSATLGRPIALAYLHRSLWAPGTQIATSQGVSCEVAALPLVAWQTSP